MRCDFLTIFPGAIEAYASIGVVGRAAAGGILDIRVHDLRRWSLNRHGQVDDEAYGGGPGMVMMASVVVPAARQLVAASPLPTHVIIPDPRGRRFSDAVAQELSAQSRLLMICGRYEGLDERVHELLAADEISAGDYVLSGGELPALMILDAVARHLPGVVGDAGSVAADSFTSGLLDYPVYTRPRQLEDLEVPQVLLSGHHGHIRTWRQEQSVRLTLRRRPDLLLQSWHQLSAEVRDLVPRLAAEAGVAWPPVGLATAGK